MNETLRKSLKYLIPYPIINLAKEIRSKIYIEKIIRSPEKIFLELGGGDRKGNNNWITLDLTRNCDLYWDLRKGIPFPNESIHKIYSSHLFEHLSFEEGQILMDECMRVLIPDGSFSICVPNAKIYIEAYHKGESLDPDKFIQYKSAFKNMSMIDYVNYVAYMDGQHKYMFDEENIISILEKKGFRNVSLRNFDSNLDREERKFESIYAKAEK